jgi:hypothetical protein
MQEQPLGGSRYPKANASSGAAHERQRRRFFAYGAAALAWAAFVIWYGGSGSPLTKDEIDAGLAETFAAERAHGHPDNPTVQAEIRQFLEHDDGHEFVNVNLIRYRQRAQYPPGSPFGDDLRAANARYNAAVLPELLLRGCVPIYASQVQGRFLHPAGADDWDTVAMVRYRSRRDLLHMVIALANKNAHQHKWAAIEKTQVFPVRTTISLVTVRLLIGVFLLLVATGVSGIIDHRKRSRSAGAS